MCGERIPAWASGRLLPIPLPYYDIVNVMVLLVEVDASALSTRRGCPRRCCLFYGFLSTRRCCPFYGFLSIPCCSSIYDARFEVSPPRFMRTGDSRRQIARGGERLITHFSSSFELSSELLSPTDGAAQSCSRLRRREQL